MELSLLVIDISIYLLILLSAINKIIGYEIKRKSLIIIDVCILFCLLTVSFFINEDVFIVLWFLTQCIQIILIYAAIPKLRLFSIIALYAFTYSINSILIVAVNSLIPPSITAMTIIEFIVHIVFAIFFLHCCFNRNIQYKIQQVLLIVPIKIKVLTLFAFCISTILMALILSNPEMYASSFWSISMRIALIFFSLFLCTTFPILIMTVLTNAYLKKQNEGFERELEAQAAHYVALAESNKELQRFKHDFKNLRIGVTKALTSGDCEIALEIIENGQNDFIQATNNIKFNTGNSIVDAILNEKQKKANVLNTVIKFDGILPQTGFSPTDLCVIFGNTLDNAIEACEKINLQENKIISVSVNCSSGFVFISITNPVSEKVIVHNNNYIETTKKDRTSHGFGLYSFPKIAKKYDGDMKIMSDDHNFTLTLELCL